MKLKNIPIEILKEYIDAKKRAESLKRQIDALQLELSVENHGIETIEKTGHLPTITDDIPFVLELGKNNNEI